MPISNTPVRRPSISDVNRMNKEELKKALKDIITDLDKVPDDDSEDTGVAHMLQSILTEIKALREDRKKTDDEIKTLRECNDTLTNTVYQQQRFLESLDADKRALNLILTGVPEDSDLLTGGEGEDPASTDEAKVALILKKIGHADIRIKSVERLGQAVTGKIRAIKVILENANDRRHILKDTSKLKASGQSFARIYVRKDIHPSIRKELNRIRSVERAEKGKAENQGRVVQYDKDKRHSGWDYN